jgi:HD-GYP domain-containing protein (c-di-GMP phosphodiesterase class II)/DNA-binding LacI/PurR family transcriptional regulator
MMRAGKTIGFFVDWLEDQYQLKILSGILSGARDNNVNILCFEGGVIDSRIPYEVQRSYIYHLANPGNVDGLIILSSSLAHHSSSGCIESFCRQFVSLPIVSIGVEIRGIPSFLVDNKKGFEVLIQHLIETHGYKRFAFIGGHENSKDASERYAVFIDTLSRYGIKPDKKSISFGDFREESGAQAINELINVRKAVFDVVIAANDSMAIGAIDELTRLGKQVPWDIAVTGFDNLESSMYTISPLTTVSQSLDEQGKLAVEVLLNMIEGKAVSETLLLPTHFVLRESCGCLSQTIQRASAASFSSMRCDRDAVFIKERKKLKNHIIESVKEYNNFYQHPSQTEIIEKLLESIYQSVTTNSETKALKTWNALLSAILKNKGTILICQSLLSSLRNTLLPYFPENNHRQSAENLFHLMRIMIGERAFLQEKQKEHISAKATAIINRIREEVIISISEEQLFDMIIQQLPGLGIESCYLVRFENTPRHNEKTKRLLFAYRNNKSLELKNCDNPFPSSQIIPPNIFPKKRNYIMIIEALYHYDQMGYIIFEMGPHSDNIYGTLRRIISSALQGSILFQQVKTQKNHLLSRSEHLSRSVEELRQIIRAFVETIRRTVEARDPYTARHHQRVADLARSIASDMGLSEEVIEGIRIAASVHDLGKIYVPAEILNKPGQLSDIEFNLVKAHPQVAYEILEPIDFPWPVAEIVLQHHERLDGSGYPSELTGKNILLEARIISVADVVEAMASHRPHRSALGLAKALEEIESNAGVLYDADVVRSCATLIREKKYELPES